MSNEIQEYKGGSEVDIVNSAYTVQRVTQQIGLIQDLMRSVMKDGEHFGVIPGCGKKPSLLKPGAEKLSCVFRLAPAYEGELNPVDLGDGHREYVIKCRLTHIPSGTVIGEGLGSCSTMEGKYRYRAGEVKPTGKPVPQEYWTARDQSMIGGPGFATRKIDGKWEIVEAGEKVEHDNPADYYNTVLKMAKKRAHVDAILTATSASDIFTQDVEDMPVVLPGAKATEAASVVQAPREIKRTDDDYGLSWSEVRTTKTGKSYIKAWPTTEFEKAWAANPVEMKKHYSFSEYRGKMEVTRWLKGEDLNPQQQPESQDAAYTDVAQDAQEDYLEGVANV